MQMTSWVETKKAFHIIRNLVKITEEQGKINIVSRNSYS
jgi:hypothetical protein